MVLGPREVAVALGLVSALCPPRRHRSAGRLFQLSQDLFGGLTEHTASAEYEQYRDQSSLQGRGPAIDGDVDVASGVGRRHPVQPEAAGTPRVRLDRLDPHGVRGGPVVAIALP